MDEEKEHVEMDEEQMDKDEMDKEQIDEEEMDEEEMDEEEEHVEMDDRGRMKDLAPVSHWQGKRERRALATISGRAQLRLHLYPT